MAFTGTISYPVRVHGIIVIFTDPKGDDVANDKQEVDSPEEEDFIELSDHPALTPAQFEQKWKSLPQR